MKKLVLFSFLVALAPRALTAQNESPLLLQSPTLSQTQIAFAYGGNLWTVARDGGEARRLIAADPGTASGPLFSPDGKLVATALNSEPRVCAPHARVLTFPLAFAFALRSFPFSFAFSPFPFLHHQKESGKGRSHHKTPFLAP
jgi:hypothetical protein